MAKMTEQELMNLKEEIDNAKAKVSELTGKQKYLKKELLGWHCKSMEEAVDKLENMSMEMKELTDQIDKRIRAIREQYDVL